MDVVVVRGERQTNDVCRVRRTCGVAAQVYQLNVKWINRNEPVMKRDCAHRRRRSIATFKRLPLIRIQYSSRVLSAAQTSSPASLRRASCIIIIVIIFTVVDVVVSLLKRSDQTKRSGPWVGARARDDRENRVGNILFFFFFFKLPISIPDGFFSYARRRRTRCETAAASKRWCGKGGNGKKRSERAAQDEKKKTRGRQRIIIVYIVFDFRTYHA